MGSDRFARDDPRRISWDQVNLAPLLQIKYGITRRTYRMRPIETGTRVRVEFANEYTFLQGRWEDVAGFGSRLSFRLTNTGEESLRLTRLMFPIAGGLDAYFSGTSVNELSFFRNGYQSWSTARSYRPRERPLRPWLQLVSLASSNLANLPSNVPGILSSEMYALITDRTSGESFLIGQGPPFEQFLYVRLNFFSRTNRESYFEIIYDFGRQMVMPGDTVELGCIYFAKGSLHGIQHRYFRELRDNSTSRVPKEHVRGWCSWYCFYNKITPELILENVDALKHAGDNGAAIDFVQIDDGYQSSVGDWLQPAPAFVGRMSGLAEAIRKAGFSPGIWIAPFAAGARSELLNIHPEYALRDEQGRRIVAGYNFSWPGHYYYGLDITNPRFEEYLRRVVRTIVGEWGFHYLKCDFLFAGCLRGGTHHDLELSRAQVLRHGMAIIREEAEANTEEPVVLVGCGMPLITGIGTVDAMRVGPDTGHFWIKRMMRLLRTGAMVGVRNSIRNSLVRGPMHNSLWMNDPDCLLLRTEGTHLTEAQRRSQINAVALTGGLLVYSDDFRTAGNGMADLQTVQTIISECHSGRLIPFDMMDGELPRIVLNTAGYLGVFNPDKSPTAIPVPWDALLTTAGSVAAIWKYQWKVPEEMVDVWSEERTRLPTRSVELPAYGSRLFRLL
jgi:alpha-galactosidase